MHRRNELIPFLPLAVVNECEPSPDLKCIHCTDGEIGIFSEGTRVEIGKAKCPRCGGTSHAA